jgi:hypothetical protein
LIVIAVFLEPFRPQQGVDEIEEDEERDGAAEDEIEHGSPLETVAGEDVEDGRREGGDPNGDHEKVEHGVALALINSSRVKSARGDPAPHRDGSSDADPPDGPRKGTAGIRNRAGLSGPNIKTTYMPIRYGAGGNVRHSRPGRPREREFFIISL